MKKDNKTYFEKILEKKGKPLKKPKKSKTKRATLVIESPKEMKPRSIYFR